MAIIDYDGPWDGPAPRSAGGSAVPEQPADPATGSPNTAGAPAGAPADPTSNPATSAADLRKLLRARMAAVLQTHPKLVQATGVKDRSEVNCKQTDTEYAALTLSATEDPQVVRDYLAALDESYARVLASRNARDEAAQALTETDYAHQQSRVELAAAVAQAAACAELAKDDVFLAAKHMADWVAMPPKKTPVAPQAPVAEEPLVTDETTSKLAALREASLAAALKAAQALKTAPQVVAAVKRVKDTACPDVKPPVRPTEEEIQRYIRGAETATINRQRAHLEVLPLLEVRRVTLAALAAVKASLEAAIAVTKDIPSPSRTADCRSALAAAARVVQILDAAHGAFGDGCNTDTLDKAQRTKPTSREVRQMGEVRDLMRQLAVARASLNEARASLNLAKPGKDRTFDFSGVNTARSWQECLEWHERMKNGQLANERNNLTRKTKVELLGELVKQLESDETAASTTLYRYILAIKPADERPPCDEMRALMNAAAWMCNPAVSGYSRSRQGDFPIY